MACLKRITRCTLSSAAQLTANLRGMLKFTEPGPRCTPLHAFNRQEQTVCSVSVHVTDSVYWICGLHVHCEDTFLPAHLTHSSFRDSLPLFFSIRFSLSLFLLKMCFCSLFNFVNGNNKGLHDEVSLTSAGYLHRPKSRKKSKEVKHMIKATSNTAAAAKDTEHSWQK